ncbi:MAG TPA: sodium-dependent transporter [Bacteroidales bacterium]|nr:sodium-dependent transporter [Bacteroidales bacterium]HPR57060.1 sodium-dependent transporter [Bacteroidales bacterium]
MQNSDLSTRDSFGSKIGVIAAAAGSAIGLGNIWRFPYVTGENGGAAFLVVYILFMLAIGVPVMLSELIIGRRAQRNPFGAFRKLKPGQPWYFVGLLGIAAAFMILAFYTTIAGWTLEYLYRSLLNGFSGKTAGELKDMFTVFQTSGWMPVFWQLVFMLLTALIVWKGIKNGIEKYSKILMPLLLIIIIIISVRSLTLEGAGAGLAFLFNPDFSKINGNVMLMALGQSFFSLSIGMGTLITYGSYINKSDNLTKTALAVSGTDTLIAILAGVAIFPAVFAFGIPPNEGAGLVFITLPNIFQQMAGGYFWSVIFFVLLAVAALTSTISVLEVVVAYFSEELNWSRTKATIIAASAISVLGVTCTLSQGPLKGFRIFKDTLFDDLDYLSANVMLPIGGLMIVIFVGWFMGSRNVKSEISNEGVLKVWLYPLLMFILKFLAPIAIALVSLSGLGLLSF